MKDILAKLAPTDFGNGKEKLSVASYQLKTDFLAQKLFGMCKILAKLAILADGPAAAKIEQHLPSLGKWEATRLALVCWGLILQERCQMSRITVASPEWGAFNTLRHRLKRRVTHACYEWIAWVWSSCAFQRPVLLVDETKLGGRLAVMMMSLAFEGRAIPLLWRCYYANSAMDFHSKDKSYSYMGYWRRSCPLYRLMFVF